MREDWVKAKYKDFLDYIQPTKYLVDNTDYHDSYNTPVLTAGKTFILGYTKEEHGVFDNVPVIIFDDFTTASKFVNFKFKAKSSAMKILKPTSKLVNIKFIYYAMQMNQINTDTHKRYWISIYAEHNLSIPSQLEQKAIVSKIEQLFSELDNGIENLKTAQQKLKIYRHAVLKKAFEGELTKEWREKQSKLPVASELMEKIKDSKKIAKIEWCEISLGSVINNIGAGKSFRCDERPPIGNEVGVLKVSAVTWGEFLENESKTVTDDSKINENYFVETGDFLFSRANTIELVGNSVIIKNVSKRLMLSDKTLRVSFSDIILDYYVLYFLRSRHGKKQIESLSTGNQDSMRNIGQARIKMIKIPLCSIQEQKQIVQEIESRLSICDNIESIISDSLLKSEVLRQSILKKAFKGKLLTEQELEDIRNHPEYESAERLLKRIREERGEE